MAKERVKWGSRLSFILAAIGSAVGLGNAWRFPAQAAKYGGGTFLIAYVIAIFILGVPLLLMELTIGRRTQSGAPGAFRKMNGKLEFVGWTSVGTAFVISTYYAVVVAWVIVMIVASCWIPYSGGSTGAMDLFTGQILNQSSGPLDFGGGMAWWVLLGLAVAWVIVYLCIKKSIHSVEKVIKYLIFIPIVLLVVLACYGATLPGAGYGARQYLIPVGSEFGDPKMWLAAFSQVFYSLSIMMAIMIAYSSFLKRDTDLVKDTVIIVVADFVVSLIAGFVVFVTLGYMATTNLAAIQQQWQSEAAAGNLTNLVAVYGDTMPTVETYFRQLATTGGPSLTFSVYSAVFAALPGGPGVQITVAMLFYFTLFTLAIDSAFSIIEGVSTAISDKFGFDKQKTTLCVCIASAVVSLIYATTAGMYWLDIADNWTNNVNLALIGVIECIAVGWVFGAKRLRKEASVGAKHKPGVWFDVVVKFVAPAVILVMFCWNLCETLKAPYGNYSLPALWLGGWIPSILIFGISILLPILGKRSARVRAREAQEKSWSEMEAEEEALAESLAAGAGAPVLSATDANVGTGEDAERLP